MIVISLAQKEPFTWVGALCSYGGPERTEYISLLVPPARPLVSTVTVVQTVLSTDTSRINNRNNHELLLRASVGGEALLQHQGSHLVSSGNQNKKRFWLGSRPRTENELHLSCVASTQASEELHHARR